MMYGRGKSSPVIVAGKPANKAQPDSVTAAESVERRAGAKGNANQPARTGLSAGSRVVLALASIRQAAMLDCQYPRWEPYAGKLHVRVCAGGARQLASLPRLRRRNFIAGLGGAVAWRFRGRGYRRPAPQAGSGAGLRGKDRRGLEAGFCLLPSASRSCRARSCASSSTCPVWLASFALAASRSSWVKSGA